MNNDFSRRDLLALTAALTVTSASAQAMEAAPTPDTPAEESDPPISFLTGKQLRVIRPNQPVTMDYSDNRVNIEVDDTGKILRVTFG
jgi:hypothetical protein